MSYLCDLNPSWCATWEDVRTWLLETTEYFELPEEILVRCSHSLPSFEGLGKVDGGVAKGTSVLEASADSSDTVRKV